MDRMVEFSNPVVTQLLNYQLVLDSGRYPHSQPSDNRNIIKLMIQAPT